MSRSSLIAACLLLAAAAPARAAELRVDADTGNSTFTAVFDAKIGERITAVSSAIGCALSYDSGTNTVSGSCSVPLTSIVVDNNPTKTEHFREWATNKKSDPKACRFEARLQGVRLPPLVAEQPVKFTVEVPFTICGRPRADGGKERLEASAILLPPGTYGAKKTVRVRAHIARFNRDLYQIGPKYTVGWLARVQMLAKVVAEVGRIDLNLFATGK